MQFHPYIVVATAHHAGKHFCFTIDHSLARFGQTSRIIGEAFELVTNQHHYRLRLKVERNETSDNRSVVRRVAVVVGLAIAQLPIATQFLESAIERKERLVDMGQ